MHRKTLRLLLVAIVCVVLPVWGEEAKPAAQSIDISKTTCKELMAGDDLDRDTEMAYFHGFFAGKHNNPVINV